MRITEKQLREIINESLLNILRRREQSPQKNGAYRVVGYCNTKDSGRRDYSTVVASLSRHIIYARDEREALRILSKQLKDAERFWYVCDLPDYLPINSVMVGDNDGNFHVLSVEKVGDELKEGKLGRALGTMALGGALMMGNPQDANAQLDFRTEKMTQDDPPQREWLYKKGGISLSGWPGKPLKYLNGDSFHHGDLWLSWNHGKIELKLYFDPYNDKPFCLGKTPEQGIKTLQSMLSLLGKEQTVYAYDLTHTEYRFVSHVWLDVYKVIKNEEEGEYQFDIGKFEIENAISVLELLLREMDELNLYRNLKQQEPEIKRQARKSVTKGKGSHSMINGRNGKQADIQTNDNDDYFDSPR